jgi:cytochrome b561
MEPAGTTRDRYDLGTIAFHWVVGIGIILLAGTELIRHELPKGSFFRESLKAIHQPAGTALLALILLRVAYRLTVARTISFAEAGRAGFMARMVHRLLYAMMLAVPLLGLAYVLGSGRSVDFGWFRLAPPAGLSLGGVAKAAKELHEALGTGILLLAGLHAAAALFHHYVLRDDVLERMRPVVGLKSGRRGVPTD